MRARKPPLPSQRYKWDIDRSVDAFFSGAYEKEIEGVSDEDDEDGENLIEKTGKNGARRREERMADSPEDESVSEYNTGDDDPDFVEIDSDEEMERLITNPRDERAREKAERQIVDLT